MLFGLDDDDSDDDDNDDTLDERADDSDEDCKLSKELRCKDSPGKRRGNGNKCIKIWHSQCTPTCNSFSSSTTIEHNGKRVTTSIYLCPISTTHSTLQINPSQVYVSSSGVVDGKISNRKPDTDDDDEEDDDDFTRTPPIFPSTNPAVVFTMDEPEEDSSGYGTDYFVPFSSSVSPSTSVPTLTQYPSSYVLPTPSTVRLSLQYDLKSTPTNPSSDSILTYLTTISPSSSLSSLGKLLRDDKLFDGCNLVNILLLHSYSLNFTKATGYPCHVGDHVSKRF